MLRDRDFLVVHDLDLEHATTGRGPAAAVSRDESRSLRLGSQAGATGHPVPLLSEVVGLLVRSDASIVLELDLKDDAPWPRERVVELVELVAPVRDKVTVGGPASGNLRALRALDPDLSLGFSPQYELDWTPGRRDEPLPQRRGAYGYYDDDPLAERRSMTTLDYLRRRTADVLALVPGVKELHVRLETFERMREDGFADLADLVHDAGALLDVWTLDAGTQGWRERLTSAIDAGADMITTNTPPALAAALAERPAGSR